MEKKQDKALVVKKNNGIEVLGRPSLHSLKPKELTKVALEIGNEVARVAKKQGWLEKLGSKDHAKVEAWAFMGCMLGITPREEKVIEHEDGTFEAHISLIDTKTGIVVGGASHICGSDEKQWSKKDRFSRRSMAVTRATGKAYRLGYSWVMDLAGLPVIPAEDMPRETENIFKNHSKDPAIDLEDEICDLIDKIDDETIKEKSAAYALEHDGDTEKLMALKNRLLKKLGEK